MQEVERAAAPAHLGDRLAGAHAVAFRDEPLAVVRIGRQELARVLDDDELTVTEQAVAAVDDFAVGRRGDRVAAAPADVDALACRVARTEPRGHGALGRPAPGHAADRAARPGD